MKSIASTVAISCLLLTLTACGPVEKAPSNGDKSADKKDDQPVVTGDDAALIERIKTVATDVKLDGEGFVVEVSFREVENFEASMLEKLVGLKRVRSVLLNGTAAGDDAMAVLGKIPTLQNIDIRGCQVSNDGLEHVAGLAALKALRISGNEDIDGDGLAPVRKLENLKALMLDQLWLYDEDLLHLKNCKNLEELYLSDTSVGDDGMLNLQNLLKLKKLRISKTQVSNDGLAHLTKVPTLTELDVSECSLIDDGGMTHVGALTGLTRLNLWRVQITDAGVAPLASLVNMQWLNLDNSLLSDAGLPHLKDMKALTFLHLGSTGVTDAGMKHLEGLTSLKDLKVTRTGVTEDGVAALKKKLPNTEIQLKYIPSE